MTSRGRRCGYDDGRFILQVVGSVSSATVVFDSVFHPSPVFSDVVFYVLGEDRLVVRVQQLMVILAHDVRDTEQVLLLPCPPTPARPSAASVEPAWLIAACQHLELGHAGERQ